MVVTRFHHYVSYAALIGVCCAVLACGESDKDRPDGPDQQSDAAHGDGALETDLNIACTDVPDDAPANADAAEANDSIEEDMPPIDIGPPRHLCESFTVRQSVEQIHLWNALPETAIEVTDDSGDVVAEGLTDYQGSLVFREIVPGTGYAVRLAADHEEYTGPLTVVSVEDSYPDPSFYEEQELDIGFGYLKTRDGTLLSYFMVLPGPPEEGPYPTLVNYSGYSPSRPGKSLGGDVELFCPTYPILCNAPDFPSGLIMGLVGYAVVGVNVRGTGCSGGAYDFFEPLQLLDGYDVIETVARQPWVKHHKVGMVGLSFPGIAQLFVAKTKPPSLAAIAPFSVIANTGPRHSCPEASTISVSPWSGSSTYSTRRPPMPTAGSRTSSSKATPYAKNTSCSTARNWTSSPRSTKTHTTPRWPRPSTHLLSWTKWKCRSSSWARARMNRRAHTFPCCSTSSSTPP